MPLYQAVFAVFFLLGSCFDAVQANIQVASILPLSPEQLLCPSTSYTFECTVQGNRLVWQVLSGSSTVAVQVFESTDSTAMLILTNGFVFTLVNSDSGLVSTVAFNTTKNMEADTLRCIDADLDMEDSLINVYVMIPAVINATPSEIFDTMDDVNCFNITWEPPPCAVGYNITTVYGGLAYSIPDPYTTICEVLCRETIRIQPIDNDGDGGYTTSVNVTHPDLEVPVISVTETLKETVTETITESLNPSITCSPCPPQPSRVCVPWWWILIAIVATVIVMLLVPVITLIVMKVWRYCQSKTVCPDDHNVELQDKRKRGSGQVDAPGYSKELEAADV